VKTFVLKPASAQRKWVLMDAKGQVLGRLATRIADVLRGKHKPTFQPNVDMGDFVVVVNASAIELTGNKPLGKKHYWHTGYPGGICSVNYRDLKANNPEEMLWLAVKRMLPRNRLRKVFLRKLKIYRDGTHPHVAQRPEPMALESKA
jgi:large subunit ribosomal protein L13